MTVIPKHLELIVASSLFSLSNAWWKNTSKESEDREKYHQWKKHAEQLPEGACLQTVPDFFSWLKSNYSPAEKHQGCEYFGRMVLHSAPWCSSLAVGLIWRCRRDVGVGVLAGGRDTGKEGPHPEEKALSSSNIGLCDWAWQLPGGR